MKQTNSAHGGSRCLPATSRWLLLLHGEEEEEEEEP